MKRLLLIVALCVTSILSSVASPNPVHTGRKLLVKDLRFAKCKVTEQICIDNTAIFTLSVPANMDIEQKAGKILVKRTKAPVTKRVIHYNDGSKDIILTTDDTLFIIGTTAGSNEIVISTKNINE